MYWLNPRTWFRQPHPAIVENQRYFSEFSQDRLLGDCSFVVLDTELTGLNRRRDEIISIGAVRITGLQVDFSDSFYQVVRPENLARTESTVVHRLTPDELGRAAPLGDILPDFISYLGTSLIVGHYPDLDMFFLNRAAWLLLGGALSNPGIDTMRLAQGFSRVRRGYFNETMAAESYRLGDLCRRYNLPVGASHNAFDDAVSTAALFLLLVKTFCSGGITNLKELYLAGRYSR